MLRARLLTLLSFSLLVLLGLSLPAQARLEPSARTASGALYGDAELLGRLQRATGAKLRVGRHARTGLLRFVGATPAQPISQPKQLAAQASPEQAARAFLGTYGPLFGATGQAGELALVSSQAAERGRGVVRFQQRYGGVPILGAELIVQTGPANAVTSVSGELLPEPDLDVQPRITAATAQQRAVAATSRNSASAAGLTAAAPELWIYDERIMGGRGLYKPALVWRTEVTSAVDPALRELVLVDAQRGNVALAFSLVHAVLNRFVCDRSGVPDTNATPNDDCDGTPPTEYSRVEGGPASGVADVNQAYDFSGDTYNFFATRFGRDSLDGAGLPLRSIVRYCPTGSGSCPFENAFWNGQVMVYGEGFASGDDVVGHELAHGVTDFTSGLFYYYQSGAINESLSDVFGELVDLTNGRGDDSPGVRWQLGEDLPASIGVIRDMKNPPAFNDPDRMGSSFYTADPNELDGGGVHSNSGVNNKAAFLLTDGGTFRGQTVQALGIDKVARLYYDVEAGLLTSAADYQDLASALQQACQNLIGAGVTTAADCVQVTSAINATEMTIEPPAASAPEAPICPAGLVNYPFYSDDLENPASGRWATQALVGPGDWYYPPEPNPLGADAIYATSGKMNFWGDDRSAQSDSAIAMTAPVALPAGAWMRFNHAYGFEDGTSTAYDGGVLEYSINNGTSWVDAGSLIGDNGYNGTLTASGDNPLRGRQAFVRESHGYYSSRLDLQTLAGQNVRFRFRIGTDTGTGDYGWFIDDIQLYTCGAAATPTPIPPTPVPPTPVPPQQRTFVPQVAR